MTRMGMWIFGPDGGVTEWSMTPKPLRSVNRILAGPCGVSAVQMCPARPVSVPSPEAHFAKFSGWDSKS